MKGSTRKSQRIGFALCWLLFVAAAAFAEEGEPHKTPWIYVQSSPVAPIFVCKADEMSAVTAQLDAYSDCSDTFTNWTEAWPDSPDVNGVITLNCVPSEITNSLAGGHQEIRHFTYTHLQGPPGCAASSNSQTAIGRQFWYYCDPGWSMIIPSGSSVPNCIRNSDTPSPPKQPPCCNKDNPLNFGNPINIAFGEKYQRETDYVAAGATPLKFERHYSHSAWRHTYQRAIEQTTILDTTAHKKIAIWARREDGRGIPFTIYDGVLQTPDPDTVERLELVMTGSVQTGWRLRDANDAAELYDLSGKLLSITTRAGIVQTLAYDVSQRLSTVTDSFGNQLQFGYDTSGRLSTLTVPGSGLYQYSYAANGLVSSVTYPDSNVRSYLYNESAYTGGVNLPNALTGIVDESSQRFASFTYDAQGRAVETTYAGGANRYAVAYNTDGSRTVTDPANASRTFSLVTKSGIQKVAAVSGSPCAGCGLAASYTHDTAGNVTNRYDFNGVQTARQFSTDGRNLVTYEAEASGTPSARTTTTTWHTTYRLPTQIDESGKRTSFTYDSSGNVLTKTVRDLNNSDSRTWTYTYNSFGQVLTADGPRTDVSDVTTLTYYSCATGYECGQVHTITNALGHVTTYSSYNAHGQPLTISDPNGLVTTLTYDARQRLASRTVGSEQTTFAYWPTGLLKKVTLPDASFLEYTYDAAHRLVEIEDSEGNHVDYTLDASGNRTAEQSYDPSEVLTQTRTRVFNTLNQLWKEIGAAGTPDVTTTFSYDGNSNQTEIDAPLFRSTAQTYDGLNRVTKVTDALSGETNYVYNGLDQLLVVTDPRGNATNYSYNALDDLKQQVSPDTGTTTNTYDSGGNLATSTDARSKTATYAYDALNRVTSVTYPDQTVSYTYDSGTNQKGRLTQVTDASGSTSWSYDMHGRVLSRQQSMGVSKTLSYAYDSFGRPQTLTLPSGNAITYGYTDGKITSLTLNGPTTILSNVLYQPFGPTRGWTWGNSTLAVREYDADGRVSSIDSSGLKTYGYDDASRISTISDADTPSLDAAYTYDNLDRLKAVSASLPATPSLAVSATSVAAGANVTVTLTNAPSGSGYWLALTKVGALYTTYDKWVEVTATAGSFVWNVTMPSYAGSYEVRLFAAPFEQLAGSPAITVAAPSQPSQATLNVSTSTAVPGSSVTVRLMAGAGGATDWLALARVSAANTTYLQWVYVGSGVTNRDWTVTLPTSADSYEFRLFLNDGYTRAATSPPVVLTTAAPVSGASSSANYSYDAVGNRLTGAGATYTMAGGSNRLQSISGTLTRSYSYDSSGNVTNDGTRTFAYNDAGRMTSASKAGVTTTYALNALGQRVKKTTSGTSTYFVYDEAGHLVGEYNNSGNLLQETVWLGGIPVATLRPNGGGVSVFYVHTDHLNTPRRISRPSDNVIVWRWDSDAFGTTAANEDSDADSTSFAYNLRFPGQYFDTETGLHYNYFRDYDPQTGRYPQSDPIGLEGGPNTYLYAGDNPTLFTDPRGLFLWLVPAAIATEEAAVGAIAAMMAAFKGYEALKKPLPDPAPDAANDPEYGDDDCPSDCRTWRIALNLMYQSLSRMQTFPGHFSPEYLAQRWDIFWKRVKRYEKVCGPYTPPPPLSDIYLK